MIENTKQKKQVVRVNFLITAASLLTGLLAGGNVDRYIVQVPAWKHVNILSWAAYSRYADLGNGIFLYSFEAIGGSLLLISASIIVLIHKKAFKFVAVPLHLATIFAAMGLIFTFSAAPVMLSIPSMQNNEILLRHAFNKFHFWGLLRAIAQLLSFFACVSALVKNVYRKIL